jgi:hypothetical protein
MGIVQLRSVEPLRPASVTVPRGACSVSTSDNSNGDLTLPLAASGFAGGAAARDHERITSPAFIPAGSADEPGLTASTTTPGEGSFWGARAAPVAEAKEAMSRKHGPPESTALSNTMNAFKKHRFATKKALFPGPNDEARADWENEREFVLFFRPASERSGRIFRHHLKSKAM